MSQDKSWEIKKADKVAQLYKNLHEVLGEDFQYERFQNWTNQYLRPSREFHGLNHMLAMSELQEDLTEKSGKKSAGVYSMVGGFFHDEDYPSISEDITHVTKRFIDKYVEDREGKKYVKAIEPDDRVGQILLGTFGFQEGQMLSPFPIFPPAGSNPGGMNEFYCAAAAACELKELGQDDQFITGVVASIEATIPFRNPKRMDQLRARIEETNAKLSLGLTNVEIDEMMVASVHLANKDVLSFLGGLNPDDGKAKPNTHSVIHTIKGGDMLSPEEIPQLRTKGMPADKGAGDYSPRNFLDARIKRAGLYHLVLSGKDGTLPNLFFETKLSGGDVYPPNDWAAKANKLAYENNLPVRTAEYARLVSAGIVNALTNLSTDKPDEVKVKQLLGGLSNIMTPCQLPADEPDNVRKLAFECLTGREQASQHDVRRSAISEFILSKLNVEQMEKLGKASRNLLLPGELTPQQIKGLNTSNPGIYAEGKSKEQMFLELATESLGKGVGKIRDDIARSAGQGEGTKAIAAKIRELTLPPVREL